MVSAARVTLFEASRESLSIPARDPQATANEAGLRYVSDDHPGIRRVRSGRGFRYLGRNGQTVTDEEVLARIRKLTIPPAWENVWICPEANGHIQATGRDARRRKQYRYHERWRSVRDEAKYGHIIAFAQALPGIRARVEADLAKAGMSRAKVVAAVVRLLETTLIRVGNDEYTRQNGSYGLTTLQNHHASVDGWTVQFQFKGKSGKRHAVAITDRRLARIVRACQELPGQELFCYQDDEGKSRDIDSGDVNDYLGEITGQSFTAKDFRTWAGTVLAARMLQAFERFDSQTVAKKNVVAAVNAVAKQLGNTRTVCRKCYIHPALISAYLEGSLADTLQRCARKKRAEKLRHLSAEEATVLAFLQERVEKETA
jgi:DNA topoisomerase I